MLELQHRLIENRNLQQRIVVEIRVIVVERCVHIDSLTVVLIDLENLIYQLKMFTYLAVSFCDPLPYVFEFRLVRISVDDQVAFRLQAVGLRPLERVALHRH